MADESSQSATSPLPSASRAARLREVAAVFLKLGTISFGGPAGHIALMESEVVQRRGWLSREEFLDLVGVTNLIPGPNSTELAIHLGHRRAGWWGLLTAGVCFIVPAVAIVLALAWGYARVGSLPRVMGAFALVKPVVLAIVVQALWRLGRTAVKSAGLGALGLAALAANLLGVHELIALFGAAGAWLALYALRQLGQAERSSVRCVNPIVALSGAASVASITARMSAVAAAAMGIAAGGSKAWPLFWIFAKIGTVLYGSGYVLLAFLRADLVERRGWLSEAQLLDAIAVGQFTPGPLFTTATFIGYLLADVRGALLATAGIFLPAFVFVAISGPLVPRLRQSGLAAVALDGINVASLALMAAVALVLARGALTDVWRMGLFVLATWMLLRYRVNPVWLVLGAAGFGLVF